MKHSSFPLITQTFSEPVQRLTVYLLAALALSMTAACSTVEEAEVKKITLYWPNPPDPPRFVYETALRSALDVEDRNDKEKSLN